MGRGPIPWQISSFTLSTGVLVVLSGISPPFGRLSLAMGAGYPRVTHPYATLLDLAVILVRLACVKHAASVRSEPGSNSPV